MMIDLTQSFPLDSLENRDSFWRARKHWLQQVQDAYLRGRPDRAARLFRAYEGVANEANAAGLGADWMNGQCYAMTYCVSSLAYAHRPDDAIKMLRSLARIVARYRGEDDKHWYGLELNLLASFGNVSWLYEAGNPVKDSIPCPTTWLRDLLRRIMDSKRKFELGEQMDAACTQVAKFNLIEAPDRYLDVAEELGGLIGLPYPSGFLPPARIREANSRANFAELCLAIGATKGASQGTLSELKALWAVSLLSDAHKDHADYLSSTVEFEAEVALRRAARAKVMLDAG